MDRQSILPAIFGKSWWEAWDYPRRIMDQFFGDQLFEEGLEAPRFILGICSRPRTRARIESSGYSEVCETEAGELRIRLQTSQFRREEVEVKVVGRFVVVHGKHEERHTDSGTTVEREFRRRYMLPNGCEADAVKAAWESEVVLVITAPTKTEVAGRERSVPIENAPNGVAPNADVPNGIAPNEDVSNWVAPNVDVPNGVAPNADVPNGVAPNVDVPNGVASNADVPNGIAPNADVPKGVAPNADVPKGVAPNVDVPNGVAPNVDVPNGVAPNADVSNGVAPNASGSFPLLKMPPLTTTVDALAIKDVLVGKSLYPPSEPSNFVVGMALETSPLEYEPVAVGPVQDEPMELLLVQEPPILEIGPVEEAPIEIGPGEGALIEIGHGEEAPVDIGPGENVPVEIEIHANGPIQNDIGPILDLAQNIMQEGNADEDDTDDDDDDDADEDEANLGG